MLWWLLDGVAGLGECMGGLAERTRRGCGLRMLVEVTFLGHSREMAGCCWCVAKTLGFGGRGYVGLSGSLGDGFWGGGATMTTIQLEDWSRQVGLADMSSLLLRHETVSSS